jgi:hypothetical protein
MPGTESLMWIFAIAIVVVGVALSMVLIGSIRQRGRFGINADIPNCPRCGERVAVVRAPQSISQFLWGGFTCKCGCEMDKWGKPISS